MSDLDPETLKQRFLDVVENQIRDADPPEAKRTYDRLTAAGYGHEETMNMLACAVANEIFGVLKNNEPVNEERYVAALKALPQLPGKEE